VGDSDERAARRNEIRGRPIQRRRKIGTIAVLPPRPFPAIPTADLSQRQTCQDSLKDTVFLNPLCEFKNFFRGISSTMQIRILKINTQGADL
jgi:hypothetical protein